VSGIAAVYDRSGGPVATGELARLLDAIAHRGPTASGWADGCVALGQRLLPTTPEAVHEGLPVEAAGGQYQLALDGRIDNRDELAAALAVDLRDGVVTDADLIVYAYERWGSDCLSRLVGDFAFALWDSIRDRLFAARDQRGFRPLAYTEAGSRLLIGSEPSQLLAYPAVPQAIDQLYLACHLTGATRPPDSTEYAAVKELPPGHYLIADAGGLQVREYWRFEPRPLLRYRRREEYVAHFEEAFGEAVRSAVRAPTAPGILLSGGLDSSYIAARAVETAPDLRGYIGFVRGSASMDERGFARPAARSLGVPLEEVPLDGCWTFSSEVLGDETFDHPTQPPQAPMMVRLARRAGDDGVSVLLDGVGGDEMFTGELDYLAALVAGGHPLRAIAEARSWSARTGQPASRLLTRFGLKPFSPIWLRRLARLVTGLEPVAVGPWIDTEALAASGLSAAIPEEGSYVHWRRADATALLADYQTQFGLPVLAWRERQALLPAGVEMRVPFWDLRVVELFLSMPLWMHRSAGRTKALLREAMGPRLPDVVVERDDKGMFNELAQAGLDRERERVETALTTDDLTQLPYLRAELFEDELRKARGQDRYEGIRPLTWAITAGLWLHFNSVSRGQVADRLVSFEERRGPIHA
jgi:asparagine synthase (glutamine-hydrolysing)